MDTPQHREEQKMGQTKEHLRNQVVKRLFKDDVIVVVAIKSAVCK